MQRGGACLITAQGTVHVLNAGKLGRLIYSDCVVDSPVYLRYRVSGVGLPIAKLGARSDKSIRYGLLAQTSIAANQSAPAYASK